MSPAEWLKRSAPRQPSKYRRNAPPYDVEAWAKRHGLSYWTVYRQMSGRREPTLSVIAAFYRESKGKVGLADWIKLAEEAGTIEE